MPDPFNVFDSLDPFSRLNAFPRARPQAAYPPLDDADTESAISKLTRGTLSGLGYVGSTLDKLTGARALRGALGGKPRELLSVLPGSDVLGLTDEADTVHGEDLLRSAGYDPSKGELLGGIPGGAWAERNLFGPGLELALDPGTYFGGISALTRAGRLASKTAPVAHGLQAIRSGQRSIHPLVGAAEYGAQKLGLSTPTNPLVQQTAANVVEGAGRGIKAANVGVRKIPGVVPVEDVIGRGLSAAETGRRSLFDKASGWVPLRTIQDSFRGVKHEADLAGGRRVQKLATELYPEKEAITQAGGLIPEQVDRYLNQYRESVPTTGSLMGPLPEGTQERLDALGNRLIQLGRHDPVGIESAAGVHTPILSDEFAGYGLQHKYAPAGQKRGIFDLVSSAFGGKSKLLPTTHGSMIRRKEALRDWAGGRIAIEDLMTPELAGKAPTFSKQQIGQHLLEDQLSRIGAGPMATAGGAPLSPEYLRTLRGRAGAMRGWLKTVPDINIEGAIPGQARIPFMDPDPIATTLLRQKRAMDVAGSANTVYDVIGKNAVPAGRFPDAVGIPEVLARTKLTGEGGMTRALESLGYDVPEEIAQAEAAFYQANPLAFPGMFDPKEAMRGLLEQHALPHAEARGATRLLNRWQVPEELQPWLAVSDAAQNAFKTGTYSIWPGSLVRNIGSGAEENLLMSGTKPDPRIYRRATLGLEGQPMVTGIPGHGPLPPALQREDLIRRAYIQGVIDRPQGEIAERVGMAPPASGVRNPLGARESVSQIAGQLLKSIAAKGWRGLGDLGTVGRQLGTKAEDTLRLTQFQDLLQKGFSDEQAAKMVAQTHFDYGDLAPFEQAVMKRLVPFYTFPRKNLPKQLARATQSPALTGGPIRFSGMLQNEEGGYVPEYLRSGLAVPFGETEPGTARYLSALGLPLEEAFGRLKIGQNLPETIAKTGEAYFSSLRPGLRLPLEVTTGKQFLTGRDLSDLHVGNLENLVTGGNEQAGRVLSELIGASPASRVVSTVNRAIDPRKYAGGPASAAMAELVPFLSGLRVSDVDVEKWRNIDARNQLERQLASSQHVKESKDYFVPRDVRQAGEVTQQEALALRTYSALKARAKAFQEQQRRVGVRVGQ